MPRADRSHRPPDRCGPVGGCTRGTRPGPRSETAAKRRASPWITTANPTAPTAATPAASMSRPSSRLNPLIRRTLAAITSGTPIQPGRWTGWITAMRAPIPNWAAKPEGCGKSEAVVADPHGDCGGQRHQHDGPAHRPPDHEPGVHGDAAQVGNGRLLGLERPRAIHDPKSVGERDAGRDGDRSDARGHPQRRKGLPLSRPRCGPPRPLHHEGFGATVQLEPLDGLNPARR